MLTLIGYMSITPYANAWSITHDEVDFITDHGGNIEGEVADILVVNSFSFEDDSTPPTENNTQPQEDTPLGGNSGNGVRDSVAENDNSKYNAANWVLEQKYEELSTQKENLIVQNTEEEYDQYFASAPKTENPTNTPETQIPDEQTNTPEKNEKGNNEIVSDNTNIETNEETITNTDYNTGNIQTNDDDLATRSNIQDFQEENDQTQDNTLQPVPETQTEEIMIPSSENTDEIQVIFLDDTILQHFLAGLDHVTLKNGDIKKLTSILLVLQIMTLFVLLYLFFDEDDKPEEEKGIQKPKK